VWRGPEPLGREVGGSVGDVVAFWLRRRGREVGRSGMKIKTKLGRDERPTIPGTLVGSTTFRPGGFGREHENDYKYHYKRDYLSGPIRSKHQERLLSNIVMVGSGGGGPPLLSSRVNRHPLGPCSTLNVDQSSFFLPSFFSLSSTFPTDSSVTQLNIPLHTFETVTHHV
jgi:hypothetical protein